MRPPLAVDLDLQQGLEKLVLACRLDEKAMMVLECPKNMREQLLAPYRKREKRLEQAVDTLTDAFLKDGLRVHIVATDFLTRLSFSIVEKGPSAARFDREEVRHFLDAVDRIQETRLVARLAQAATFMATLTGLEERLTRMADTRGLSVQLPVVSNLMRFGRLHTFEMVKKYADAENPQLLVAALHAPLQMFNPTKPELEIICPWAKNYLSHESDSVFKETGLLLIRCRGDYIEALQDEGDRRLKEGRFVREDALVFRELCHSSRRQPVSTPEPQKQCARNLRFLEKAANTNAIDPAIRALVLDAIFAQRRDARTLALMQRYAEHPAEEIRKVAARNVDALQSIATGK